MSISSDEINFLVYRYLQENGFAHSAFTFAYESLVVKSTAAQAEIPPGALITFLQKGLEYIAIEEHIQEDGTIVEFDDNYSLLSPMICEALVAKEDRRKPNVKASAPPSSGTATSSSGGMPSSINPNTSEEVSEESKQPLPSTVTVIEEQGHRALSLKGHRGEVFMCVWSPSRSQLASGSADGLCRLWGLQAVSEGDWQSDTDLSIPTAVLPHIGFAGEKFKDVTSITWSPDGQFLATGCYDGTARIWTAQGELVRKLVEHTGPVFSLKWARSGKVILSGSYDRRAIVWNAETGKVVRVFALHDGPVLDVDWRDSEVFATCSSDKTIFICSLSHKENKGALRAFQSHNDEVNAVSWSPNGTYLASCSDDHSAKIYTLADGQVQDLSGHTKEIFTLRWTPITAAGMFLCTASFDGSVKVWQPETGKLLYSLSKHPQPVYSLAPSPNGLLLASGALGGTVCVWSMVTGTLLEEFKGEGDTFDVSWSVDSRLLCCCFSSGKVVVLPHDKQLEEPSTVPEPVAPSQVEEIPSAAEETSAMEEEDNSKPSDPVGEPSS